MTTQTLAELQKHVQDDLVGGVAEDIITVSPIFDYIPFIPYEGTAVRVNRENALGDAGLYAVGDTITHRSASTVTPVSFTATKILGQVDLDGLVEAQSQSGGVDMAAHEISSKAKSMGRIFQQGIATGAGSSPAMNSLHSLVDSEQYASASSGRDLSFELLDELIDLVLAKDGQCDFLLAHRTVLRKFKTLYRALGGADPTTIILQLPNGQQRTILTYEGIPFLRNDYLSTAETANGAALTGGSKTSVYAGCFDDGSRKVGIAAIYPAGTAAGINVKQVGESETKDEMIWRLSWYTNFVCFNRRGLARAASINT